MTAKQNIGNEPKAGPRGARRFAAATLAVQACALARYFLLARALGPVDLGLAASLILAASFFEMVTDGGAERFLIQHRQADDAKTLGLVHLHAVTRGFAVSLLLLACSGPLARFFGEPALAAGFMGLALYPAIYGFRHLDYRRQQRDRDFRTESRMLLLSELAGLAGTALGIVLLGNFMAVIVGQTVRALSMTFLSHYYASWRYRFNFSAPHARALAGFSLPLMVNGAVLFAATQGDRVLIGKLAGVAQLGVYSAVMLLIYYPMAVMQKWMTAMAFPAICAAQSDKEALRRETGHHAEHAILVAIAAMWGFTLLGGLAAHLIFGPQFTLAPQLIGLIGVYQALRLARIWPSNTLIAIGATRHEMLENLVRLIGFPLAFVLVGMADPLLGVVAAFTIGEALSFLAALALAQSDSRRPLTAVWRNIGAMVAASFACGALVTTQGSGGFYMIVLSLLAAALTITLLKTPIMTAFSNICAQLPALFRRESRA